MKNSAYKKPWDQVIAFWFPESDELNVDASTHHRHWFWRMRGGADSAINERFSALTTMAAHSEFADWAADPYGRLALIIVLDQFSRSVWRGTARSYKQDPAALALTIEGISNGHYAALSAPWHKVVFGLPLGHCEGPDHLERIDLLIQLRQDISDEAPVGLQPIYQSLVNQAREVRQVVAAFGRHPHRNQILGRPSTAAEEAYIAEGRFPHLKAFEK